MEALYDPGFRWRAFLGGTSDDSRSPSLNGLGLNLKSSTLVFPVIHQSYQTFSGDFFQSFWLQCVFTLARSNDVLKEPGLCSHAIVISTKLLFQPSSCQTRVNHAKEVYIHVSRYLSEKGRSLGFFTTREEST